MSTQTEVELPHVDSSEPVNTPAPADPPQPGGPGPKPRWRDRFREQKAAAQWTLTASIGAIAISWSQGETSARLLIPMAVMVTYAFVGFRHALGGGASPIIKTAKVEKLGDSLYFLGFIWTLWALIDSLVFKQLQASEAVFRTFGYALVTTATGMFLRLLFIQFKFLPGEGEALAEQELEHQVQRFSAAVTGAIEAVNSLKASVTAAQEWRQKAVDEVIESAKTTIKEVPKSLSAELKPAMDELVAKVKSYGDDIDKAKKDLKEGSSLPVTAAKDAAESLKKSIQDVESAMKKGRENIETTLGITALYAATKGEEYGKTLTKASDGALKSWEGSEAALKGLAALAAKSGPLEQLKGTITSFAEIEKSTREALKKLEKQIGEVAPARINARLDEILSRMDRAAQEIAKRNAAREQRRTPDAARPKPAVDKSQRETAKVHSAYSQPAAEKPEAGTPEAGKPEPSKVAAAAAGAHSTSGSKSQDRPVSTLPNTWGAPPPRRPLQPAPHQRLPEAYADPPGNTKNRLRDLWQRWRS